MHTIFWLQNLKGRDHLEDLGVWEDNIKMILGKQGGKVWSGYIWLMIGASGWLL
jgi:hypothetical protein